MGESGQPIADNALNSAERKRAEEAQDRAEWAELLREAKYLGYTPTQVRAILVALHGEDKRRVKEVIAREVEYKRNKRNKRIHGEG